MNENTAQTDYRVNTKDNNNISIEIKCCGQHIGEIRFKDGQSKICPQCGTVHNLRIEHNHFHISQNKPE
ncbi:MAG: hypothetical protein JL50_11850 [Peptococcaceae bacterium BICA1-7]|nr:MAG: hypothetical protein JL50_11850 [Peptococcaceae bacterium BICA1-7]HBV98816.1 hypothetical protein [Desulfotomaculum sp.]